nr:hypothetical protein [uncultured Devosia sp.]
MSQSATEICLLTFVLQEHHCTILEDWLDFFDRPVSKLIVHIGADPEIRKAVEALARKHDIVLVDAGTTTARQTTENELDLLAAQFQHVASDELACLVKLDTFPFRAPGRAWQDEALLVMQQTKALFITGSTLPYRADLPTTSADLLLTQRVSNCFLIVSKQIWFEALKGAFEAQSDYGRFAPEGDFEAYLAATGHYGLRILNTMDVRIFHCHEWGPEQARIRAAFREGQKVRKYLSGFQDDYAFSSRGLYLQKPLPWLKRVRIALGRWRRGW